MVKRRKGPDGFTFCLLGGTDKAAARNLWLCNRSIGIILFLTVAFGYPTITLQQIAPVTFCYVLLLST